MVNNTVSKISNAVESICKVIGGISVGGFIVVVTLQVICRNFLKMPLIWANDISLVFFIWSVFFGSAVAVRHRKHYVLDLIPERLVKINLSCDLIGDICGFLFFGFLILSGFKYTMMGFSRLSTSINIPQAYFFMCIPLSACFMFWFNIGIFAEDCGLLVQAIKGGTENNE